MAESFEIGAIEEMDAQNGQNEIVEREPGKIAGRLWRVTGSLPTEQRNVAFTTSNCSTFSTHLLPSFRQTLPPKLIQPQLMP